MKRTELRSLTLAATLLLPKLAFGHPGHFLLDPNLAPHSGHEGEIALLLFGAFSLVGVAIHRWIARSR